MASDLPAVADAYVRDGASASSNFGSDAQLIAKRSANLGNTRETYLRFNIAATPVAAGQTVKLRLFGRLADTVNNNLPVALLPVSDTTWGESTITWNTKPAPSSTTALDTETISGTTGKWYEWDVTSYVLARKGAGAGAVSFLLRSTNTSDSQILFNAEEGASNDPVLSVSDPAPAGTTVTLGTTTAAYVRDGSYATWNFGNAAEVLAKRSNTLGNTREGWLRFDLSSITGPVTAAKLRLNGKLSAAGSVAVAVHGSSNTSWSETVLTWNNRPAVGAALTSKTVSGTSAAWHEWDVTGYLQQLKSAGATGVTFVLRAPNVTDPWAIFASDDNATTASRPQLVVTQETSQPVQGLVLSKTSLTAAEGATGSFTVRLNAAPTGDVTVTVARDAGDTDLSASPPTLVFTPTNWDVPQTVTVAAAQDADATNGQATFAVSASGFNTRTLIATEADDDVVQPPPTTTRTIAIGDASYVRGGASANTNFGTAPELLVKRSASADNVREAFLKIDLSGVANVSSAKLRLFGGLSAASTGGVLVSVYSANAGWTEGGITYNNRPRSSSSAIASKTITSTTKSWHEFDLNSFLRAEKAAGRSVVSLVLRAPNITDPWAVFNADGAANNRPEVVIQSQQPTDALSQQLDAARAFAEQQFRATVNGLANNAYPQYTLADGSWKLENENHWTAGLLPGALWQLYGRTGDTFYRDQATARTTPLAGQASKVDDLTFRILNSYRPLFESTGSATHRQVLLNAAASKNTQWNEVVGAFRTPWRASDSGDPRANFGVLMDQSMDMELMFWAARETGNQQYYDRAVRHLRTVAEHVVRDDGGSYHWVYFDRDTGEFISGETYQGYSDESTWARGQAWGIHAFATAWRETGLDEFRATAEKLAAYFVAHLPADKVPFWDFDDPAAPDTFKDSSAAAIAASGMLELSRRLRATGNAAGADLHLGHAKEILASLSSSAYLAQGTSSDGVLLHGALNVPTNTGTDASLIFGDYYFLEALNRYAAQA